MKKIIKQEISFLKRLRKTLWNDGAHYNNLLKIDRRIIKLKNLSN